MAGRDLPCGLEAGDVVVGWAPVGDGARLQRIRSVLDWRWLVIEHLPRGAVRLAVERSGEPIAVELAPGTDRVETGPVVADELLEAWQLGWRLMESSSEGAGSSRYERGAELWRVAGLLARAEGRWQEAWAIFMAMGERRLAASMWDEGRVSFERALETAVEHQHPFGRVAAEMALGDLERQRGDLAGARGHYHAASEMAADAWGDCLVLAACVHLEARVWRLAGEGGAAEKGYRRAVEIRAALAPTSVAHAESLMGLADVIARRGDPEGARLRAMGLAVLEAVRASETGAD